MSEVDQAEEPTGPDQACPARRRWWRWGAAGAVVLLTAGVGAAWAAGRDDGAPGPTEHRRSAVVERTTLSSGLTLAGQLGYGEAQQISGAGGVITALPTAGDVIGAGSALYAVDGHPALVATGDAPLWRDLELDDTGEDVRTVRQALAGLGYPVDTGTDRYDAELAATVAAAFRDRGYIPPVDTPAADQAREEARTTLDQANAALAAAQAALTEKSAGASAGELAEAQTAVGAAGRALAAAQAAAENPESADGTELPVADALDQLTVAEARLTDLTAGVDLTAENSQVTATQREVDTASAALRAAEAGTVGPSDLVVVAAGAVRVDAVTAVLGQQAEGEVLSWTGTTVHAFASLTSAQARGLESGTAAEVELPDGTVTGGTIAEVTEAGVGADGETIPARARIDLTDPGVLDGLGLPAVSVSVPADEAADALVVPVTALLALAEGGYAVEVVDPTADGSARLIPVEVGLVADTRAQVITDELAEGDEVVIP